MCIYVQEWISKNECTCRFLKFTDRCLFCAFLLLLRFSSNSIFSINDPQIKKTSSSSSGTLRSIHFVPTTISIPQICYRSLLLPPRSSSLLFAFTTAVVFFSTLLLDTTPLPYLLELLQTSQWLGQPLALGSSPPKAHNKQRGAIDKRACFDRSLCSTRCPYLGHIIRCAGWNWLMEINCKILRESADDGGGEEERVSAWCWGGGL